MKIISICNLLKVKKSDKEFIKSILNRVTIKLKRTYKKIDCITFGKSCIQGAFRITIQQTTSKGLLDVGRCYNTQKEFISYLEGLSDSF